MKSMSIIAGAFAMMLAGASVAEAQFSRSGGGTGPRGGTWSSSGSGSCYGGSCSSQGSYRYTSPAGKTYSANRRSGTTCGGGSCTRNSTWSR